jgi:acyl-CoA thioester hydrolase
MSASAERFAPEPRSNFRHFDVVTTRWNDNDIYGHVNNAVYYAWFDSVVNAMLIAKGLSAQSLDASNSSMPIGLVVSTQCQYFSPVSYPAPVEIGLRVEAIGKSSVTYRLDVFSGADELSLAGARYTHVYVDSATRRPVLLPDQHRAVFEELR